MLKKFFLAILAVTMALFMTNVNECYARSVNESLPNAEKAVLAYAQVYGYGSTELRQRGRYTAKRHY